MPMPLPPSASAKPLNTTASALPWVGNALAGWWQPMSFTLVTKTIIDHEAEETGVTLLYRGVRQPLSPQQLAIKPEGQRAWKWQMIHAEPAMRLNVDDIIAFDGIGYRVMHRADWSEYGYMYYEIAEAYGIVSKFFRFSRYEETTEPVSGFRRYAGLPTKHETSRYDTLPLKQNTEN